MQPSLDGPTVSDSGRRVTLNVTLSLKPTDTRKQTLSKTQTVIRDSVYAAGS